MVLCHSSSRTVHRHTDVPIPPLNQYRQLYEAMLAPLHPGKVVAVSLNTQDLDDAEARRAIERAESETGLPAAHPVREGMDGCRKLSEAVMGAYKARGKRSGKRAR